MDTEELSSQLNMAASLLKQGRAADARALLDRILAAEPAHAGANYLAGAAAAALNDIQQAEERLSQSLSTDPAFSPAALLKANLLAARGAHAEALDLLDRHQSRVGADKEVRLKAAELAFAQHDLDVAEQRAGALLATFPNEYACLVLLGRIALEKSDPKTAERHLNAAAALTPSSALPPFYLARALVQQGRLKEADAALTKAARLRPGAVAILQEQARTAYRLGEAERARGLLDQALRKEPRNISLQNDMAQILHTSGAADQLHSFYETLSQYPDDPQLLAAFAHTARAGERLDDAIPVVRAALDRGVETAPLLDAYAQLLSESGRHEEAVRASDRAVSRPDADVQTRIGHCNILLAAGAYERALEATSRLIQEIPGDQLAQGYHVSALTALGRPEAAPLADIDRLTQQRAISCPTGFDSLDAFNKALTARLLELHSSVRQPLHQSVRGGTQLELKPILDQEPLIAMLATELMENVRAFAAELTPQAGHPFLGRIPSRFRMSGIWSVCLRSEGHHAAHVHPEGWLSSAYYVHVPKDLEGVAGGLNIGRPPMPGLAADIPGRVVPPRAGHLTLFPSYMWHGTEPFTSESPRITVAFDIAPA